MTSEHRKKSIKGQNYKFLLMDTQHVHVHTFGLQASEHIMYMCVCGRVDVCPFI